MPSGMKAPKPPCTRAPRVTHSSGVSAFAGMLTGTSKDANSRIRTTQTSESKRLDGFYHTTSTSKKWLRRRELQQDDATDPPALHAWLSRRSNFHAIEMRDAV